MIKRQNDEVNQRFIQKVDVVIDPTLDEDFDGSDFNVKKI
jgi:hypothetical protein